VPKPSLLLAGLAALAAVLSTGCSRGAAERDAATPPAAAVSSQLPASASSVQLARVEFHVEGMTCGGCVIGTRAALKKLDGVQDANASYENSSAWARYDPAKVTPEQMIAAIRELGYTATVVAS
jgi:copper chaperone CopZ